MMTKELRLTHRFGSVLAVAALVAFVGGTTATIAAHENGKDQKQEKKDDKKDSDWDKWDKRDLKNIKRVWRKVWICHLEKKDGKAHLLEISEEAAASHRGHGDGEPGERSSRRRHFRWTRECRETPEPPPPPPPPPPADPQLACPCWNTYKQSALLAVLEPNSTPAANYCIVSPTTMSLSQDQGINTLVYAASFGQCILRVGGVDVNSNFALTAEEAGTCISEAQALVPSITWCAQ